MIGERPAPRRDGVSDSEAVALCRQWMVYLGETDAVEAVGRVASVCDLFSSHYVALVDNKQGNIGLPLVERGMALASADGRRCVIFHSGGCLPNAGRAADQAGIAVIMFDPENGDIEATNQTAVPVCRGYHLP
ncbi:hypothetical protein GCM10027568_29830 [Humibacter soli]